jgi:hypothetical protein
MRSPDATSGDPVDRYIGVVFRNWVRSVPPPANGRARLFETLREKPWDRAVVKMSLLLLLRTVTFDILSPPIAPAVQPVLYSGGKNGPDPLLLLDQSTKLAAQMMCQVSCSLGAGVFSIIA